MTRDILGRSRPPVFWVWRPPSLPSRHSLVRATAFVAGAVAIGAVAWCGNVLALPLAVLFPALWAFSPSRFIATLVAAGYFLSSSRGLPEGVTIFYATDMIMGIGLWLAASLCFVVVHSWLWTAKQDRQRPVRYAMAVSLMSVPPFGIVGWASPITAAGVLFPGWGWFGLVATAIGLSAMTTRAWSIIGLVFGVAFLSATSWTAPKPPAGWIGIDTEFDYDDHGRHADYGQHLATIALVRKAATVGASKIVLPESAFGIWTPTTERFWKRNLKGLDVTVAGGAIVVDEAGYDNIIIEVTGQGAKIIYRERMPVPVSMWQPWSTGGAAAHFFDNPQVGFAGTSIVPLICYEQLIVWPIVQSMLFHPDVIVAIGNGWWTGDTNIVAIQKASAEAWAALFEVPLVTAFNK